MALPWVRLDTGFPMNPKILGLVEDKRWQSICAYIAGLAYSGQHGTDGFLPASCLPFLHATRKNAADLVAAGLWIPCPGGWDINGWAEFQPSSEENQRRRDKARAAAEIRWAKERDKQMPGAMPQALPDADASGICTDGRTDGLTNEHLNVGVNLKAVDARRAGAGGGR